MRILTLLLILSVSVSANVGGTIFRLATCPVLLLIRQANL